MSAKEVPARVAPSGPVGALAWANHDAIWMREQYGALRQLVMDLHDVPLEDLAEVEVKAGGIRLVCEEWLSLARRRSEERQTQEADDCCPVVETYSIGRI